MNEIESRLNSALETVTLAKEIHAKVFPPQNILIEGLTGSGKTAIVKQWAKEKGVPLVAYDLSRDVTVVYQEDSGGILRPVKAEDPVAVAKQLIFHALREYHGGEDFILFLDDYHNATRENLEAIYYTMDHSKICNPATGEELSLENLLFTIAIKTTGL